MPTNLISLVDPPIPPLELATLANEKREGERVWVREGGGGGDSEGGREGGREGDGVGDSLLPAMGVAANRWSTDGESGRKP